MPTTKSEDQLIAEHLEAIKKLRQKKSAKERRVRDQEDRAIAKAVRALGLQAVVLGLDDTAQKQVQQAQGEVAKCRALLTGWQALEVADGAAGAAESIDSGAAEAVTASSMAGASVASHQPPAQSISRDPGALSGMKT